MGTVCISRPHHLISCFQLAEADSDLVRIEFVTHAECFEAEGLFPAVVD